MTSITSEQRQLQFLGFVCLSSSSKRSTNAAPWHHLLASYTTLRPITVDVHPKLTRLGV